MQSASGFRVFAYRGTANLGDAIQTIALCRLLGDRCIGVYRDEPLPSDTAAFPLIANGWLGYYPFHDDPNTLFAGVHLASHHSGFVRWIRRGGHPVGARDPYTTSALKLFGVQNEMIGCATLTFERYYGPRSGRFSVDASCEGMIELTQDIPASLPWPQQWTAAQARLECLRRAEVVYTSRLHIVLPCLAFGTPVVMPASEFENITSKGRLSLLAELPFELDQAVTLDVAPLAHRYWRFLETYLGPLHPIASPRIPLAL